MAQPIVSNVVCDDYAPTEYTKITITATITNTPTSMVCLINGVAALLTNVSGNAYTTGEVVAGLFGLVTAGAITVVASNASGGSQAYAASTITISNTTEYASYLSIIDWGIKGRIFTEVQDILGLTSLVNDSVFFPKEVAQREIAEKRGKDQVEFFNIWRGPAKADFKRQRTSVARRGIYTGYDTAEKTFIKNFKAMPATLDYDIWFWTTSLDKKHLLEEWYIWWQQNNPNLALNYNDVYPLELDLHFGPMVDEGTVPIEFSKGKYHVLKVGLTIDGWIFKTEDEGTAKVIVVAIYDDNVQSTSLDWIDYNAGDDLLPNQLDEYAWYLSPTWASATVSVVDDTDCVNNKALQMVTSKTAAKDSRYFTNTVAPYPDETESWMNAVDNVWGYVVKTRCKITDGGAGGTFVLDLQDGKYHPTITVHPDKVVLTWSDTEPDTEYAVDLTDAYHVLEINGVNDMVEIAIDGVEVLRATMSRLATSTNPQLDFGSFGSTIGGTVRFDYVRYICKTGMFYRQEIDEEES